jgi:hypothetical protein
MYQKVHPKLSFRYIWLDLLVLLRTTTFVEAQVLHVNESS